MEMLSRDYGWRVNLCPIKSEVAQPKVLEKSVIRILFDGEIFPPLYR